MKRYGAALLAVLGMMAMVIGGAASASRTARHVRAHRGGSPIVVCGDLALSGVYTQIGADDNQGAVAYFDYVNKHGGIDGHKVTYITENNQSSPAEAELLAKECIQQKHANVIFGPESGADTEAALPIAIANHVPLLSMSSGWKSNGYPAAELHSYGFPVIENVFYEDDYYTAKDIIAPRHYTRAALIQDNCGSVCLANQGYVQGMQKKFHFKLVSTQTVATSATDVTPQVTTMLAAKPQVIILGLVPGTDTITVIRAIRAQNPTIPISECSACYDPSFVTAAGGLSGMKNVYMISPEAQLLQATRSGHSAVDRATAAQVAQYLAGMKAAGFSSANSLNNGIEGWAAGEQLAWAIGKAKSTSGPAVMKALQHLDINTLGVVWKRSVANYENIGNYVAAMSVISSSGKIVLYNPA